MELPPTPACTPDAYLPLILTYVLPPAGALLSAIALWVASKARSMSGVAQSTSEAAVQLSLLPREPPERSAFRTGVPDRRKSSTRETTSTAPGDSAQPPPTDQVGGG